MEGKSEKEKGKKGMGATMRASCAAAVGFVLFWAGPAAGQAPTQDTVKRVAGLSPGARVGTITEETPEGVTMRVGSTTVTIPVEEIQSVEYAGRPTDYLLATASERSGRLEQAAQQYGQALKTAGEAKKLLVQDLKFALVRVAAKRAVANETDVDGAIRALEDFRAASGKSRHEYPASEWLGRLYLQKGDYERAGQAFARLEGASSEETKLKAAVRAAEVYLKQKKYAEAEARFDKVYGAEAKTEAARVRRQEAMLGKAGCMEEQQKFAEAEKLVRQVVKEAAPEATDVNARAYNALGDCLREAGRAPEAVRAYLHVDLLFPMEKDEHAKALYYLSELWPKVNHPGRGDDARERLEKNYAGSVWAKRVGK